MFVGSLPYGIRNRHSQFYSVFLSINVLKFIIMLSFNEWNNFYLKNNVLHLIILFQQNMGLLLFWLCTGPVSDWKQDNHTTLM